MIARMGEITKKNDIMSIENRRKIILIKSGNHRRRKSDTMTGYTDNKKITGQTAITNVRIQQC